MNRKRNYILKNNNSPEEDIWVELDDEELAVPMMRIYCESEIGKQLVMTLTTAMALRLITVLGEMLKSSNSPIEGYVTETKND